MPDVSLTVVGAGVVGLAISARLAPRFPDLVILERNPRHGMETSSRNSEVIHAGLFYPPGSLKARLCVEGAARLRALCASAGIPHRITGKLVVATSIEEEGRLDAILANATSCGALLEPVTAAGAARLEPLVRCRAALHSSLTGIVGSHALMGHLLAGAGAAGATLRPRSRVVAIAPVPGGYELQVESPAGRERLVTERVVNAAGLDADLLARAAGIDVEAAGYAQHWAIGRYFAVPALAGSLSRLVYPTPGTTSLGIHAVIDLAGRVRFGPDISYLERREPRYTVDPALRGSFGAAIRRYLPALRDDDLQPDVAGIRPKLQRAGEPFRDFAIAEESLRGLPGLVTLAGIESPGLTSSLAIARLVDELLTR